MSSATPVEMGAAISALRSATRREILRLVWDQERAAGAIAASFDMTWPAISQNLGVLRRSGLLVERRAGTKRYYRADREALRPLESALLQMWEQQVDRLGRLAEAEEAARWRT